MDVFVLPDEMLRQVKKFPASGSELTSMVECSRFFWLERTLVPLRLLCDRAGTDAAIFSVLTQIDIKA
jgi:hypothetical protein